MIRAHRRLPTVFVDMDCKRSKQLSRFRSSEDLDYKKVIDRIQSSLVFKSCISESLKPLFDQFVICKFPIDFPEHRGRIPLHWAASAPNPAVVETLINTNRALVSAKANDKQTPLHRAMKWARGVEASQKDLRQKFELVIEKLIQSSLRIDAMDGNKATAWEYANGPDEGWNETLKKLKDTVRLIRGPLKSGNERSDILSKPTDDQTEALQNVKAFLIEVFPGGDNDDCLDWLSPVEPFVYDLIYSPSPLGGLENIFYAWRPPSVSDRRPTCRWVHLPANNVRASPPSDERVH